ncbi:MULTISPECIES: response regulator transcription factor [Actinomadura]|uniref:LuxR C-terminal-related transcriptional regulator n=1 Tax=Actinomadura yumaensis TaxID=111807 RepID=A0ABW2CCB5_9ACTN|nr:response regulator transcription factor [Actinomadura sp. J1-007]MWK38220.1 response regulator [Actinomadura sp. J1-007]
MRVMLAEDGALFRQGLTRLLEESGFTVAAAVGDAPSLLAAVRDDPPDVAIVDVRMPPGFRLEGMDAALRIRAGHPHVGVLVLSHHIEAQHAVRLLGDDPRRVGYLLKDRIAEMSELADALTRIVAGGAVVDPALVAPLMGRGRAGGPLARLSERELQVLALMAEGRTNQSICRSLTLSPKTVETHVRNIFRRLRLPDTGDDHRRVLAVLSYLRS